MKRKTENFENINDEFHENTNNHNWLVIHNSIFKNRLMGMFIFRFCETEIVIFGTSELMTLQSNYFIFFSDTSANAG